MHSHASHTCLATPVHRHYLVEPQHPQDAHGEQHGSERAQVNSRHPKHTHEAAPHAWNSQVDGLGGLVPHHLRQRRGDPEGRAERVEFNRRAVVYDADRTCRELAGARTTREQERRIHDGYRVM